MADLSELLPLLENEGKTVYNKTALNALKKGKSAEEAAALEQALANQNTAPLTQNPFVSGLANIDKSKLPSQAPAEVSVDLGKAASGNVGDTIPASADAATIDTNQDITGNIPQDLADRASKWQALKSGAPYAGAAAAGTAAGLMSGGQDNGSQAAQASSIPPTSSVSMPTTDVDVNGDDEDESKPSAAPAAKAAATAKSSKSDNEDDDEDQTQPDTAAIGQNIADVQKLADLQKQAQTNTMLANLGGVAANMAYSMGGRTNPNANAYQAMVNQQGQMPVAQYMQQIEMQKYDPNSPVSAASRKLAAQMGYPQPENASAADIEKLIPQIANLTTAEEAQQTRRDIAQQRSEDLRYRYAALQAQREATNVQRQALADQRQDNLDSKRLDTYSAKAGLASSRSVLGQAQNQIYSVDRVDALLHNHGDLNNITPQEMVEVAKGLDRVISGGASTLEGSKQLDPGTAKEWIAKQLQSITNHTMGAQGGEFLARIESNLQREKETAINQASKQYQMILAGSGDIAKRNPTKYSDFLDKLGVNPELKDYMMTGKKPMTIDQQTAALNKSGINSSSSVANQGGGQQTTPQQAPVNNGMVKVKTSDGKTWTIPKNKLSDAQQRDPQLQVLQ